MTSEELLEVAKKDMIGIIAETHGLEYAKSLAGNPGSEQNLIAWCIGYQAAVLKAQKLLKAKPNSRGKEIVLGFSIE